MSTGRIIAGTVIVLSSAAVMYQACERASAVYFFEMDTVNTIFIERQGALAVPILLSLFACLAFWTTKRTLIVEEQIRQQKLREKAKLSVSRLASRKGSHSYTTGETTRKTSFSLYSQEENIAEQAKRLKRLLSAIEEQDTIQATRSKQLDEDIPPGSTTPPAPVPQRFTVEKVDTLRSTSEPTGGLRRRTSSARQNLNEELANDVFDEGVQPEIETEDEVDPYQRLMELDSYAYLWSILNFSPSGNTDGKMSAMDFVSELVAVHIPIWGCVAALYVVLLEVLNIKLSYYFYYHGSVMGYCALFAAVSCGLIHEFKKNWITNNILAFSCVYVVIARFQAVSYQTSVIVAAGLIAVDIFWYYVVDLLSTVVQNKEAPLFITIPCDFQGNAQRITTPTIITPAIVLGVVLKYSSMYDSQLYMLTFYAVVFSIAILVAVDILKGAMLPGIVLPSLTAVVSSLAIAIHREDLWRFMIKH